MWKVCFAVIVIPTAIFVALVAFLEVLIYGGESDGIRG
jgi:hypothetical protein